MIFFDEYEMSRWAFYECKRGNDISEIRKLITDQYWIYEYCYSIKDTKKMWSKINESLIAGWYCKEIKDRPEVRKYIK